MSEPSLAPFFAATAVLGAVGGWILASPFALRVPPGPFFTAAVFCGALAVAGAIGLAITWQRAFGWAASFASAALLVSTILFGSFGAASASNTISALALLLAA